MYSDPTIKEILARLTNTDTDNTVNPVIFAASQFSDFAMQKFCCILISHFPRCFTRPLKGKLNFNRCFISPFFSTLDNFMHKNNTVYNINDRLQG